MTEVQYPGYRKYVQSRIEVNDAMTAMLAGSRLAAHALSSSDNQSQPLAELFPSVPHIKRFNLRSDDARRYLDDADFHIASVAVPYALATHEDFVMDTLGELRSSGFTLITHGKPVKAWNMHTVLFETCGATEPLQLIQLFHVLREVRNSITHAGGEVSDNLEVKIAEVEEPALSVWRQINGGSSPEDLLRDGRVAVTAETMFTAFAITKSLGREINELLSATLPKSRWASIATADFSEHTAKARNSSSWRRSLVGYARHNYSPVDLQEIDLETAARSGNFWTKATWS
ncbi:hypothetical protein [Curtobacterium sp. DN_7.5]|uniref:hypothetical protein n=1 Tax=Curtobacterium sp. DN_7.5 TaxID=3049047 RepID=UPI001F5AC64B|nr:hypothetical protein [Curtobacterium sp. DN_7.5]